MVASITGWTLQWQAKVAAMLKVNEMVAAAAMNLQPNAPPSAVTVGGERWLLVRTTVVLAVTPTGLVEPWPKVRSKMKVFIAGPGGQPLRTIASRHSTSSLYEAVTVTGTSPSISAAGTQAMEHALPRGVIMWAGGVRTAGALLERTTAKPPEGAQCRWGKR